MLVVPPLEKVTKSAAAREITEHWRDTIRQQKGKKKKRNRNPKQGKLCLSMN